MTKHKRFDCVEMKNRIQARLLERRQRLGDEEFGRRNLAALATSESPIARKWRRLAKQVRVVE